MILLLNLLNDIFLIIVLILFFPIALVYRITGFVCNSLERFMRLISNI